MTRIVRVVFFLFCLLTTLNSKGILSFVASGLTDTSSSEPNRLATAALLAYCSTPLRVVLILLGVAVLICPWVVSVLEKKRVFSRHPSSSDRWFLSLALVACFAAALSLNIVALQGCKITPDENTYLDQARIFAQGKLYGKAPPLPEFFEEPYLAHKDGKLFSVYQPGWSLLLTPAVLLGVEQALPPLTATLALLAIFLLARTLYGSGVARAAVLIMLFSPYFLLNAATYYSHIAELLWLSLFALAFVGAREQRKTGLYLIAGICLAAGFLTRYFDLFFGFPFGLLLLWDIFRGREGAWKNGFLFVSPLLAALGVALFYQWILTGDPFLAPHKVYIGQARYIYILSQLKNPYQLYGFNPDYTPATALLRMLRRLWQLNLWVFAMALLFVVAVLLRPRKWELLLLAGFACNALAYVPYFPTGGWQYGPRYYFPVFGCLALIIARGMEEVIRFFRNRWKDRRPYRALLYGVFFCLVFNVGFTLIAGTGIRLITRGLRDQGHVLASHGVRSGIVFVTMAHDFYAPVHNEDPSKEEQLRRDIPYYLIHNGADYGQDLLFAHSLGQQEDSRLLAAFPDRKFYLFRANPFAAAFGIGTGELEEIR